MNKYIRELRDGDLEYLAENLRQTDVEEITADTQSSVLEVLEESVGLSSLVRIIDYSGVPMGIFGVGDYNDETGIIWMVGTTEIETVSVTFLRYSKQVIAGLFKETGKKRFQNFTYAENTLHHRWLEWCGAYIGPGSINVGPDEKEFLPFTIERYKNV